MLKNVFLGDWSNTSDVINDFGVTEVEVDGYNIIVAAYETGSYEGSAFVLLEKDGKYFEVNGGHCSCYGLEGQWELEEVPEVALKHRVEKGDGGYNSPFNTAAGVIKGHFGW